MRLILLELGHPQPPTPIHIDNITVVGIVNNTIKRQSSQAMEMRYFWLLDGDVQKMFSFRYHPGQENMGDFYTKAFNTNDAQRATPFYLQNKHSPHTLVRAMMPSTRRGCVGKIPGKYVSNKPLPFLPSLRARNQVLPAPAA